MTAETPDPDAPFASTAFQRYEAQLHRFLARRLARPHDVDDLAQEVFMRLARIEKPELIRKPQAYLLSIAANLVYEFRLRGQKEHEQVTYDSATVEQVAEHVADPSVRDNAEDLDLQRRLDRALEQLPPMQRAVLLLVKRDGYSHKEVAKKTGLNVRTVERYVMEATATMLTMDWEP
ncbi:RNA polymerase sigma factor [Steroidobacter sp.]|uniref:RNA polymerase sigma factor n=1 Tax=Steroidobacter sp. TaxID=1978227 RepID=UPI001A42079C|nr:RNA polymerase sigma factor [Steroidobacter sp.]MBL8267500.1 RNA polymerase sigma factor [Steroidobacter sp.]